MIQKIKITFFLIMMALAGFGLFQLSTFADVNLLSSSKPAERSIECDK